MLDCDVPRSGTSRLPGNELVLEIQSLQLPARALGPVAKRPLFAERSLEVRSKRCLQYARSATACRASLWPEPRYLEMQQ